MPAVTPTLIADNSANVKGRGQDYAIKRIKKQLARHYREHGESGYILLVDLSNYFGSIEHEHAKEILGELGDPRLKELGAHFIDQQGEVGLGLGDEPDPRRCLPKPHRPLRGGVLRRGGLRALHG